MNTIHVIGFSSAGVSVLFSLLIWVQYRRAGTPVPGYEVGATAGSVGMLLLVAGVSKLLDEGLAMALVVLGSLLTAFSAVMTFRARRQMRIGGRSLPTDRPASTVEQP